MAKPSKGPGKMALIIGQAINNGKYKYGDHVATEDVEGIYTTLFFCKRESLDTFIKTLERMREAWED